MVRNLVFFSKCGNSFATFDLSTCSWKTSQLSLFGGCEKYSEPFPKAAIMLSGKCYLPLIVEQGIKEKGGGVSHTQMWPTPTLCSAKGQGKPETWLKRNQDPTYRGKPGLPLDIAARMWPTPTGSSAKGTGPLGSKSHKDRLERGHLDAVAQENEGYNGSLNPDWVELLMGYEKGYTNPDVDGELSIIDSSAWLDGTWEADVPRITKENVYRKKRLLTLGNTVVPQCVEVMAGKIAGHILSRK